MSRTPEKTTRASRGLRRNQQLQPASRQDNQILIIGGVIVGLVALVLATAWYVNRPPGPIEGLFVFNDVPFGHTDGPTSFAQTPPVGGVHHPVWQNCGIYDEPIPDTNAVHSLEHGAVWITYDPNLPPSDVEKLRSMVRSRPYMLLSPYEGLPAPVVASAWGYQIHAQDVNDPRIPQFIRTYRNSPDAPEPGALCTAGVGVPIEQ